MDKEKAIALGIKLISDGTTHKDYTRVTKMSDRLKAMITGEGVDLLLRKFAKREDDELFKQRQDITEATTPAICETLELPFNMVTANDRIKKKFILNDRRRQKIVEEMAKGFFGEPDKDSRGLDYWMNDRYKDLSFTDPNAWVVIEWDAEPDMTQAVKPRPFEVSAHEAVNFLVKNDRTVWLFVKQEHGYAVNTGVFPAITTKNESGFRYTLYDRDTTVVYTQVDKDYTVQESEGVRTEIKGMYFIVSVSEPKLGYAPVFRIGYKRDRATKGRTFVCPYNAAMPFLNKSLKVVSELDLTMSLHAFPQKIAYVQSCPGTGLTREKKCNKGYSLDGGKCGKCNGSGHILHTTAQESIFVPMPDDPSNAVSLEGMMVYKAPPIDLIKFQNEYCLQLERQCHQATFNSTAFVKKNLAAGNDGQTNVDITATADDYAIESVYYTLRPYTTHYSETWIDIVSTFIKLSGAEIKKADVSHKFPQDPKLKNTRILLQELKTANDSGAPSFMVESINNDLAEVTFAGDPLTLLKMKVQKRFYPFSGKTTDEVAELMQSKWVPDESKVLNANFQPIFREIEDDTPLFYELSDPVKQKVIVTEKVLEWKLRIEAQQPTMTFNMPPTDAGAGDTPVDLTEEPPAEEPV